MKIVRLKKRANFLTVSQKGFKVRTPAFTLQICLSQAVHSGVITQRVGFTASKKVGNAVIRNRCKRRLRALIDKNLISLPLSFSYDIVLVAQSSLTSYLFSQLEADFSKAILFALDKMKGFKTDQ
ncbi:MAG: Ribonuclease P protein component [Holosporales bacterium]